MRFTVIATIPLLVAFPLVPAQGQISARVHIDIPIGRQRPVYAAPRRHVVVRTYDRGRYGPWETYYDRWVPETVYLYDGLYYDYPVVPYAEPVVVYRYRDEVFFAPRERAFNTWHTRYRPVRPRPVVVDRRSQPGRNNGRYSAQRPTARGRAQDRQPGRSVSPRGGSVGRSNQPGPGPGASGHNRARGGASGRHRP